MTTPVGPGNQTSQLADDRSGSSSSLVSCQRSGNRTTFAASLSRGRGGRPHASRIAAIRIARTCAAVSLSMPEPGTENRQRFFHRRPRLVAIAVEDDPEVLDPITQAPARVVDFGIARVHLFLCKPV